MGLPSDLGVVLLLEWLGMTLSNFDQTITEEPGSFLFLPSC